MLYVRKLIFCQKSKIHHFWYRKRKSLVKLIDTYLISSAMPFFLSDLFSEVFSISRTRNGLFFVWSQDCGQLLPTCVLSCLAADCSPVHAFYRPVVAYQRAQRRCVCRQTAHIQPLFSGLCAGRLLYRVGFIFCLGEI